MSLKLPVECAFLAHATRHPLAFKSLQPAAPHAPPPKIAGMALAELAAGAIAAGDEGRRLFRVGTAGIVSTAERVGDW